MDNGCRCAAGHHARLQRQDLVDPVGRELVDELAVHPLLVVTSSRGTSGWVWRDDGDLLELDGRLLQLDVDGVGLAREHA